MSFESKIKDDFYIDMVTRTEWNEMPEGHFHSNYELYYLAQGQIMYFIDDKVYPVEKGDLILIPPGVIHRTSPKNKPFHKRVLISFSESILSPVMALDSGILDCYEHRLIKLTQKKLTRASYIIDQILKESNGEKNMALITCYLCELLILINRHIKSRTAESTPLFDNVNSEKILEIVSYINMEFRGEISLNLLSEKFFISPAYLSLCFKKVTGFLYSDYIMQVRIKNAIKLLLETDLNITEVAFEIGFNSSNHFCKAFKAAMGVSPLKYRKLYKN